MTTSLTSIFGEKVKKQKGEEVDTDTLKENDVIGIYFSAHWCPPCRGFTPVLVKCYKKLKESGKKFEIVFVSSDRDKKSFEDYYSEMPWLTIGFASDKKDYLNEKYKVKGIPTLVLVDGSGDLITTDGRSKVAKDPDGNNFPWDAAKSK